MIQGAIKKVVEGISLSREEAAGAMRCIMNGEATDAQIGGFLVAMRQKGETIEEIASFARVMREKAVRIGSGDMDALDTCGTGGDGANTFNISTIAAFVAAGAGIRVAKHGNRSVSSKCGSADVLMELGIKIDLPPERISECLCEAGIAFLFAPLMHASMKYAIGPRRELGIRTFFNLLGPMTNPAGARRQLLGVYSGDLVEKVAGVLADLGSDRAFVVHGSDGLDEITTTGETAVAEIFDGVIRKQTIIPEDFGLPRAAMPGLIGSGGPENAAIFIEVLSGKRGPRRDIVLLNSAFAICAGGGADSPADGLRFAEESINSGAAMEKYRKLKEFTSA